MSDEKVTLYGIWIFSKGWLRIKDDFFATDSYVFANEVSNNIGNSRPRILDNNSVINEALETLYLKQESTKQESRSICHIFKNLFKSKIDNSNSKG